MTVNKNRLANTFALATGILWVLCSTVVWLLPDLSWQVVTWWMHGVDISLQGDWNLTVSNFLFGGITITASAWAVGWVFGWSWEKVAGNTPKD